MFAITGAYAALLALLLVGLSARVILFRRANRIGLGDGGDASLLRRMRAQSNCAEYAPLGILLLALTEANGAPALAVHVLGLALLAGRLIHAAGFGLEPERMGLRILGMVLTLTMILVAALGLLAHSLT